MRKKLLLTISALFMLFQGANAQIDTTKQKTVKQNWHFLGTGENINPLRVIEVKCDVAVIGGGMAGISAAVAAARQGAEVLLVNDRPVLGGNASSEIRITVNGATPNEMKGRETGIVEEILIANHKFNPQESYPVWDHVLYNFVEKEPNLTLMLNTCAMQATTKGNKITSVICWQTTSETQVTIKAPIFIDCTGDGTVAASAGANYRTGREGKAEFGEKFAPDKADGWVMGETIMMITRDLGKPVPFYAPAYAKEFNPSKAKHRSIKNLKEGFWWVELGSDYDVIADRAQNYKDLMAYFYGVWDYVKNSGDFPEAENLALDWVGSLPGKRESRRIMGDYILSDVDMLNYKEFEDAVAWGGWSLDEHCPGGIRNMSEPASYFHDRFTRPYQIPYRCIYSNNIDNLYMAGRNASVSHVALSSTRIIGTCCMMGQAAGVAAAMCVEKDATPREIYTDNHIKELQERMLREDYFIPYIKAEDPNNLAKKAKLTASSTESGDIKNLLDGVARDVIDIKTKEPIYHYWMSKTPSASLNLNWDKAVELSSVELKFDTDLTRNLMMHKEPGKAERQRQHMGVPAELVKNFSIEAKVNGKWSTIATVKDNITRYVPVKFETIKTDAIRINLEETYGAKNIKMYELRCY